jgi:short-subunit dehydrogenase
VPTQRIRPVDNRRYQRFRSRYGPWALVTGASDGIGKAVAAEIAAQGVNVVLCARRRDRLETIAADLAAAHGVQIRVVTADLVQPGGVDQLVQETRHLGIGLVILSAGFATSGPFADAAVTPELEMVCLNVTVATRLAHTFAQRMVSNGHGGIVLVGSILGRQGVPWVSCYAATKAYVRVLAEGLHQELKTRGIDVLAVEPGPVHTGFEARAGLKYGSAARPQVVAKAVIAALGKRASVIPGVRARLLATSMALLPRRVRVRFLGEVMRRMRLAATSVPRRAESPAGIAGCPPVNTAVPSNLADDND